MPVSTLTSEKKKKIRSPQSIALGRLKRNKTAMFGLGVIMVLILSAVFSDIISPYSPTALHSDSLAQMPNRQFLLGTDYLGRDILSRLIYGSRVSIVVGIFSVVFSLMIGVPLGMIAGYRGGKSDMIIMRIMEILMAFPIFLLAIMIMIVLGPSLMNVIISLGIVRVPIFARLVRGSVLSIKEKDFVFAAQALAFSNKRILFRYILPNYPY